MPPPKPKLNVQNFPRPPLIERTPRHLQIKWHGQIIADTKEAYWILETYHPPSTPSFPFLFLSTNIRNSTVPVSFPSLNKTNKTKTKIAYYLPPTSILLPLTVTPKRTFCEWKGWATYYSITSPPPSPSSSPSSPQHETISNRIWSYESPNAQYEDLKGYLSFYAGPWDCYVDGELVKPQPGDFYGGWTTGELVGLIKGEDATRWL
ncbi:hypothetical protein EG329_000155 [Mollisiaceae sp. DMI_Dod_QoI]|nr:hypothetical protein EG329_000155 [Helotiales sp. DMI_Dod_QoI]